MLFQLPFGPIVGEGGGGGGSYPANAGGAGGSGGGGAGHGGSGAGGATNASPDGNSPTVQGNAGGTGGGGRMDLLVVVALVVLAATVAVMLVPLGALDYQILLELVHLFSMLVVAVAVDHRAVQEETVVADKVLEILPH